jgi:hypothetical protein
MKRPFQFSLCVLACSFTLAVAASRRAWRPMRWRKSGRGHRSKAPDTAYIASLSPLQSGPGLMVFEPVASSPANTDWGAGASRWLQLHVGGQGEFGKTPTWGVAETRVNNSRLPICASTKPPRVKPGN